MSGTTTERARNLIERIAAANSGREAISAILRYRAEEIDACAEATRQWRGEIARAIEEKIRERKTLL